MPAHPLTDVMCVEALQMLARLGNQAAAARALNIARPTFQNRVAEAQRRGLDASSIVSGRKPPPEHPGRIQIDVQNGTVVVGSDAHIWPDRISTALRAFVHFCKKLKPAAVVLNGDVFDGATVSRHPPINWEQRPTVAQEIEACQDRLGEIEKAAGKAHRIWTLGNHDARLEVSLASRVPEFAGVKNMDLKSHFPLWEPCWSVWINGDVVIKHRFKGGLHSTFNGTMWAGKTMVNGHLHSLRVTPFTDYVGTRYGVDTGTLADCYGPQFEYTEGNPVNWRSGFAVLTFRNGRLMWPEVVHVIEEGVVEFRGELYNV